MKREIMTFLENHGDKGRKTSEIAGALKITDYQARYYLLQMERENNIYRTPPRRGKATYWYIK